MHKFVRNLLTEWRKLKLPFADETILVGVSGGADSVSLALSLSVLAKAKKLSSSIVIGHFNHDLRGDESRKDAEFVEKLAKTLNFKFVTALQNSEFNLKNQNGNLEQNARYARYKFLEETALLVDAKIVLTAHTLNDQAETFLMRLIRGSGRDGLGGIKSRSKIPNSESDILLVRPFLSWSKREDTEEFCRENNVAFREDSMNDDLQFSRVRVRKELIPLLTSFNTKIVEKIANSAFLLQEDTLELDSVATRMFDETRCDDINSIKIKYLRESTKSLRKRVIRLWILKNNFNLRQIDSHHIEAIDNLMFSRKSGKNIELPDGIFIIKNDGKLFFENSRVEKRPSDI